MNALVFGEILWDIIDGKPHLGGAPFNLAAHLAKLGSHARVVSAVGDDDLGNRAIERAEGFGIDTGCISRVPGAPTGTVDVVVHQGGQPDYVIHEGVAWDRISLSDDEMSELAAKRWDVVCMGTLAQRTEANRTLLYRLLTSLPRRHVFYDVNLRQEYYRRDWIERSLHLATIVKLNEDEATVLDSMLFGFEGPMEGSARRLREAFALDAVVVTCGADGAFVYDGGVAHRASASDVSVVDTVGAGDSFGAGFLTGYLSGLGIAASLRLASHIADFVVSRSGAIPEYPPELARRIEEALGRPS